VLDEFARQADVQRHQPINAFLGGNRARSIHVHRFENLFHVGELGSKPGLDGLVNHFELLV
jgi:hypothetical protein